MKSIRTLAALLLALALSSSVLAQPTSASTSASGPKWFHHHKKNPNENKVHHAKPAHRASKHKAPKH